jgi:hypothetical protein
MFSKLRKLLENATLECCKENGDSGASCKKCEDRGTWLETFENCNEKWCDYVRK